MFKIVETPEFTHTVRVMVPTDGGHAEQTFRARFRVLRTSEVEAFETDSIDGLLDMLRAVFVGAEDLVDAEGNALPWSDAVRDALLDLPYVRAALARTYWDAITKARAGN
jgi:hypothetical protein